jgi:peptide/nickel transport system permease protein
MNTIMRLIRGVISLWVIVTLVFVGLRMTGDPVLAVLNPDDYTADMIAGFRKMWGFEGTIWDQYVIYVLNVSHGNFGKSILNGQDALHVVGERLPATLSLVGFAAFLMVAIGIPVGTLAAMNAGGRVDRLVMSGSTLGFAMPSFVLGLMLILIFAVGLRWLPSTGSGTWLHVIMPGLTIGVAKAAIFTRFVRSSVLEALKLPCITAARARGFNEAQIFLRHVMPNSLIPVVTMLPLLVGAMISASAVVETVFAWPGIGRLLVESVAQRNLAIVQVIIMFVAIVMISTNLIVDVLYAWLDPRTTRAAKA